MRRKILLSLLPWFLAACAGTNSVDPTVTPPGTSVVTAATLVPATQALATRTPLPEAVGQPESTDQPAAVQADADVIFVRAVATGEERWTFHVTVSHPDTGATDYADGWDVVLPDGTVVKKDPGDQFTRLLLHPHVNEQPFTRSQSGLEIDPAVNHVTVRAHDLVAGFGGQEVVVDLTVADGEHFTVERDTADG